MKKLSLLVAAMIIVTLPACWRKAETPVKTTAIEVRQSGPMQDLQEEDMK